MPSEKFDKKVKQAADQLQPSYDEKAWDKMEQLLEKHLPQKQGDRRRIIFFLLLFLLLGGGLTWVLVDKPWQDRGTIVSSQSVDPSDTRDETAIDTKNNTDVDKKEITTPSGTQQIEVKEPAKAILTNKPGIDDKDLQTGGVKSDLKIPNKASSVIQPLFPNLKKPGKRSASPEMKTPQQNKIKNRDVPIADKQILKDNSDQIITNPINDALSDVKDTKVPVTTPAIRNDLDPAGSQVKPQQEEKTKVNPDPIVKKKKESGKNRIPFFFSLSTGPDVSVAGSAKIGRAKLLTGAGLGYTFKERITLRTGFYTARKIYSAGKDDYNPPPGFWANYPYLDKVDADCHVYEIPLSISYNFGKSSQQKWFGSAGLSSYFMKRETYNYFYKYSPTGTTYQHEVTIRNRTNHYFSVLTLSGGYQRELGKAVNLTVEPYVKLPVIGVGYGKVKLNSGGVLFTVGIKPFSSKIKK